MFSPGLIRTVVGILGNITSCFLLLSPLPTLIGIWKKRSVEQYSVTTYLATLANCMLWGIYGMPFIHPNSILVLTISALGCFIEIIYLLIFIIYSDSNKKRLVLVLTTLAEILAVAIIFTMVVTMTHTTKRRAQIIGIFGDIAGVAMYAAPLSVMKQVITTKSVEYMPLAVSLASFATSVIWGIYAFCPFDPYIAIPNGLGCLLGLAQLILYATYYKSTKHQLAARKASASDKVDLGLKEVVLVTVEPNTLTENDDSTANANSK